MMLRESALAVFTAKAVTGVLVSAVWGLGWPQSWNEHERWSLLLQVLTFVSAATALWLRIEVARDAFRRGYRKGRAEASTDQEEDQRVGGPR